MKDQEVIWNTKKQTWNTKRLLRNTFLCNSLKRSWNTKKRWNVKKLLWDTRKLVWKLWNTKEAFMEYREADILKKRLVFPPNIIFVLQINNSGRLQKLRTSTIIWQCQKGFKALLPKIACDLGFAACQHRKIRKIVH